MTETHDLDNEARIWGLGTIRRAQSPGSEQAGIPLSLNLKKLLTHPETPSPFHSASPPPPLHALPSPPLW